MYVFVFSYSFSGRLTADATFHQNPEACGGLSGSLWQDRRSSGRADGPSARGRRHDPSRRRRSSPPVLAYQVDKRSVLSSYWPNGFYNGKEFMKKYWREFSQGDSGRIPPDLWPV